MRIHLLGGLEVEGLETHRVASRKGRRLLSVLAVAAPDPVPVDALAEALWPGDPPARPADQVGVLVSRLRRVLGADRIVRNDAGYRIVVDWCDLDELEARVRLATDAVDAGRHSAARAAASAALALGDADLLPEEDGAWVEPARARAGRLVAAARRVAVEACLSGGDLQAAVIHAEHALAADPLDEATTRALMLAQFRLGRPAEALATYGSLRHRLADELGVSPQESVETLHTQILLDEVPRNAPDEHPDDDFVGRELELEALDGAARDVGEGCTVVVIEGEPGVGKSRLLDRWVRTVDRSQWIVLTGRCDPLGRDLPLQPVADAIASTVAARPALLGELAATDRDRLAASLGIGDSSGDDPVRTPDGDARLFAAIERLVRVASGGGGAILVLDDLRHAGSSTTSWLAFARRRARRLLVVGACHPGTSPVVADTTLSLGGLSIEAVRSLVGPERAPELHERSGGHPLLLRALADAAPGELPASLRDATERQLAALGPAAATIRDAAVLGPAVDLDLVAELTRSPVPDVLAHLESASRVGLLVDGIDGLRFRHELLRRALEEDVSASRRAFVHREAARRLVARPRPDWTAIAYHARLGDDPTLAASASVRAAVEAERRFDPVEAERYLDEAVELHPDAATYVARARVRMSRLRLDVAADDAAAAVAAGGGAAALEIAAWIAYYRRDYRQAVDWADEAVALADDDAVRVGALALGARVRHGHGDLAPAVASLALTGEAPPNVQGVADVWRAHLLVHTGDPRAALTLADRALAVGDGLAQPFAPLHGRFARVMALGHLGRLGDARRAADELDRAIGRFGPTGERFIGPAANVRSWLLRNVGRHEEADDANRMVVEAVGTTGPSMPEAYWVALLDLADGALSRGDLDGAAALAQDLRPLDEWDGTMAWHQRHRLGLLRARLVASDGDPGSGIELAHHVAEDAAERGARRYETIARAIALALGPRPSDPAPLAQVVSQLPQVAGLEAWRLLAELAARHDGAELRGVAEREASRVIELAGPDAPALRRWVAMTIGT